MERPSRKYQSEIIGIRKEIINNIRHGAILDENSEFYGIMWYGKWDIFFIDFIKKHNYFKKPFLEIDGGSDIFSSFLMRNGFAIVTKIKYGWADNSKRIVLFLRFWGRLLFGFIELEPDELIFSSVVTCVKNKRGL